MLFKLTPPSILTLEHPLII